MKEGHESMNQRKPNKVEVKVLETKMQKRMRYEI